MTRVEELQAKDTLTPEEEKELNDLIAAANPEPDEDSDAEFDDAWDNLDGGSDDDDDDQEPSEAQTTDSETAAESDDSILNPIPAETSDTQDNGTSATADSNKDQEITLLQKKLQEQEQRMRSWEGRLKAADKRAAEAEARAKELEKSKGQAKSDKGSLSEDDPELADFFAEFPDLEAPIKKVAEKIALQIVDAKMAKVDDIAATVAQTEEEKKAEANRIHAETITKAHPDWKEIYSTGALETWVKLQPAYLQPRLYDIIREGTTQEVIDMFDSYKKAAGKKPKTVTTTPTIPDSKKARVKAMEAVPAQTAGPKKPSSLPPKDDFDAAWDHFENEETKKKGR